MLSLACAWNGKAKKNQSKDNSCISQSVIEAGKCEQGTHRVIPATGYAVQLHAITTHSGYWTVLKSAQVATPVVHSHPTCSIMQQQQQQQQGQKVFTNMWKEEWLNGCTNDGEACFLATVSPSTRQLDSRETACFGRSNNPELTSHEHAIQRGLIRTWGLCCYKLM
jgi:hypothetical protein